MPDDLSRAVSAFSIAARAKLTNPGATGAPEDQLRAPLEALMRDLSVACGLPAGVVAPGKETSLADFYARCENACIDRGSD